MRVKLTQIQEYLPAVLLLWIKKKVFRDILEMSGSNHVSDFVVTHAHFLCRIIDLLHSFFNFMLKLSLGLLRPLGGLLLRLILATNMSALVHPLDSHVVPFLENVNHEILALGHVLSLDVVVLHIEQILHLALSRRTVLAGFLSMLLLFLLGGRTAGVFTLKQLLIEVMGRLQCH